ncbi:hypothetical protein C095_05775 [Fusobacterium necrophorum subsp. funduliforme B35]|uniref:Uncharacterized protein n=1 Tax=Fusobacterium necrophorum subsp. funduliforme B35 TaxID=1226633 RepID=A0A0B4E816_9FUSO|nr:hypothetical protein C095_05775 [Fusobacterium necrophorum subsp. funduliforme B35]
MSMIKEFLGEDLSEKNTIKAQYSLEDLQSINNNISEKIKELVNMSKNLVKKREKANKTGLILKV